MITREEITDLCVGDVVELADTDWNGASIRGPLRGGLGRELRFVIDGGAYVVRTFDGRVSTFANRRTLTVISRAPRPVYVNHPRTGPTNGDIVRDADSDNPTVWMFTGTSTYPWFGIDEDGLTDSWERADLPTRLHLLVDGATGQAVT